MADVNVVIGVDNKGALTGMKQVGSAAEDIEKKSGGAAKALGDVAKIAGGFIVAQGLMKLPGLLSGFIGGASDLNESLSKVQTVFGSSSKEIEAFASTAAKNLGMTKQAALEATGTFGNFLQAMGATTPAAAEMSKGMVTLATDLGSFNNADPTEVLLALRSGLSGEAEPLRKFGVALSAAAVNAKALEMGLKPVGKEFTEQQKIQARYAIIMEQTSMAQGDFARTSGGLANQTKILKAMFSDASTELGSALLPGIVKLAGVAIQLLPVVISLGKEGFGALADVFRAIARPLGDFIGDIKWVIDNGTGFNEKLSTGVWAKLAEAIGAVAIFLRDDVVPAFKTLVGLAWDGLKAGAEALGKIAGLAWGGAEKAFEAIRGFASAEVAPRLRDIAGSLREIGEAKFDALAPQFDRLRDAIRGVDLKDLIKALQDLRDKVQPAVDILKPLAERVLVALKEAFADVAEAMKPLAPALRDLGEALKPLVPLIEPIAKVLGTILVLAIAALLIQLEVMIKLIAGALTLTIQGFVLVIEGLTKAIDLTVIAVGKVADAFGVAWNAVRDRISGPINAILGMIQGVIDKVETALGWLSKLPGVDFNPQGDYDKSRNPFAPESNIQNLAGGGGGGGGGPTGAYGTGLLWDAASQTHYMPGTNPGLIPQGHTGFLPAMPIINIENLYAQDEAAARDAAGTIGFALASSGLAVAT